ncbi:trypsin-like peptidase domain-containing protein [Domibacillus antri]|uniref:trypsin-like peptidase domain-containing protein n=1 Tax=Domibacillus antri TaxID=1714264 RepID=UPI0009FB23B6|nr:trypsin-like peptidase domain-containing protein [Domibacillus antri]
MHCPKCGAEIGSHSRFCPGCGMKHKKIFSFIRLFTFSFIIALFAVGGIAFYISNQNTPPQNGSQTTGDHAAASLETIAPPEKLSSAERKILTDIISVTQQNVYTIFTDYGQGSGFLINDQGDVATNAHVVEGTVDVIVKDIDGIEHEGTVIGYSNETDVALIRVPDFAGYSPVNLETVEQAQIGEEVIALGSPLALENTAVFGYITGVDRSFMIERHSFDNVYQTSAAIAPVSSGGPLVSKNTGRVIAIHSAKTAGEDTIVFSIPYKDVNDMIMEWSRSPMTTDEVTSLFYSEDGRSFFDEYWTGDAYFDGGEYSEDADYDFYNIPADWWYVEEPVENERPGEEIDPDMFEEEIMEEEPFEELPILEDKPMPGTAPIPYLEDVNDDGLIDVNDVTEDVNEDGVINELDLEELLMMQ